MKDVREILNDLNIGKEKLGKKMPDAAQGYMALTSAVNQEGAMSVKNKELIMVALGAYNRCEYCIVSHVYKALEAGATPQEIYEAAGVAIIFGGGPTKVYVSTLLIDAVETLKDDFKK